MRRNCPQYQRSTGKKNSAAETKPVKPIVCHVCGAEGHTKANCPEGKAWLATKKEVVAAAEKGKQNICRCSVAVPWALPRIYLDVCESLAGIECTWARGRSMIDTGSTQTLIAFSFATIHCISFSPQEVSGQMVALDGSPVNILGAAEVQLRHTDGPVALPCISSALTLSAT